MADVWMGMPLSFWGLRSKMVQISLGTWAINQNIRQEKADPIVLFFFFFLMYNSETGRKDVKEVKLHKVLTGGICKKIQFVVFGAGPS